MVGTSSTSSIRVFISYAHVDDALRERLRAHLSVLEREGLVQAWDDRQILGGDEWADEIDDRLNQADVILLLVSADFIKSEYCYGKELGRALERQADPNDRAIVIPIILRACDWESSRLGRLQALPRGARPLSDWKNEDEYFAEVTKGLRRRIQRMADPHSSWSSGVGKRWRDPAWWRRPRVMASLGLAAVLAVALAGLGTASWLQVANATKREMATAVQALRTGRYDDAAAAAEPACGRWPARVAACFTLDKARLGVALTSVDSAPLDRLGERVEALKAAHADDPDLLLLSAQLALRESRTDRHAQALADVGRAIRLAGGDFPEAYFYLAHLQLQAGRPADALPLLDKALQSSATASEHHLNMRAYARAQTGNIDGARQDYEQSAERGSILSRIELAELLWRSNEFERARDQLVAANHALGQGDEPLPGRNALPWAFELSPGRSVVLKQAVEKRCHARWMLMAARALTGEAPPDVAPDTLEKGPPNAVSNAPSNTLSNSTPGWVDCGPEATRIAAAIAAALARAAQAGMDAVGQQRAATFQRLHGLPRA